MGYREKSANARTSSLLKLERKGANPPLENKLKRKRMALWEKGSVGGYEYLEQPDSISQRHSQERQWLGREEMVIGGRVSEAGRQT